MDTRDAFDLALSIASEKVQKNTDVVVAEQQNQPFMIHITKDQTNKAYIPRIGQKQGHTEDRTLPRITVADTLLGCMIGYAIVEDDFFNRNNLESNKQVAITGYRINRLDYDYCLKPNARLVFDAQVSNEHWLISYNKQTLEYKPVLAGRLFIHAITVTQHVKADRIAPDSTIVGFVEVKEPKGIYLTSKIHLAQGYHTFTLLYNQNTTFEQTKKIECTAISKSEFDKREKYKPSLEQQLTPPAFANW